MQASAGEEVPGLPHQRAQEGVPGVPQDCLRPGPHTGDLARSGHQLSHSSYWWPLCCYRTEEAAPTLFLLHQKALIGRCNYDSAKSPNNPPTDR